MKACKVNEKQLEKWIDGSTGAIRYLGPAITENLARKILEAEKRTGERSHVVIELDDDVERNGYGKITGVRIFHDRGAAIQHRAGLRIAAFAAPGIGVVWSPIAERVDPIDHVSVNGIWMEDVELDEFRRWMSRMMGDHESAKSASQSDREETSQSDVNKAHESISDAVDPRLIPAEPQVRLCAVNHKKLDRVETHLKEHPPRDFKKEKQTEVYQGYVGFIEIHVIGASLSEKTTLAIPKELIELGLKNDLRGRLSESMRIDLSDRVDLGVGDLNKRVDAFREIFTKQMGPPLGRIYKKKDWKIMQEKWEEMKVLVDQANKRIDLRMRSSVEDIINNAATEWAEAIENSSISPKYNCDQIRELLLSQWDRKKRATLVKLQLFVKDLTWATLNDEEVRKRIEEAYPELCATGLYKSRRAWTSEG